MTARKGKPGRKSKLTDELQTEIANHLMIGCTVRDACELASIGERTFYEWMQANPQFSQAVTQAQARARRSAVRAITSALMPSTSHIKETTTIEETRLRTVKLADGTTEQQPYTYRRTTTTFRDIENPADWRAGIEYLKRRDRNDWSDKTTIQVDDWRSQAIADIKAGKISFEALRDAFDEPTATDLFAAAGADISPSEGAGFIQ